MSKPSREVYVICSKSIYLNQIIKKCVLKIRVLIAVINFFNYNL